MSSGQVDSKARRGARAYDPRPFRPDRENGAAAAREAIGVPAPSTSLRAFAASRTRRIQVRISIRTASISLSHFVASVRYIERFEASRWSRRGQSRPFEFANRLAEIRRLHHPPGALDSRPLDARLQHQSSALLARLRHLGSVRRRTRTATGGFQPAVPHPRSCAITPVGLWLQLDERRRSRHRSFTISRSN